MKHSLPRLAGLVATLIIAFYATDGLSQRQPGDRKERFRSMSQQSERRGLADPFKGVTTDGNVEPGLFAIRSTGVSTEPVRKAAGAFLATLSEEQRAKTMFPVDDPEWRKWMNQHFYVRQGVGFNEMTEAQRDAAFGLMRAALSAKGLKLSRDIMKLNHTLGELNDDLEQYGEWLYWITVMGKPSATAPWGFQVDGHHLILNYFVLGDQVVMTPTFIGSEPVIARAGKYKGISIMQEEQDRGLALVLALNDDQRAKAVVQSAKNGNHNAGEAFKDNAVVDYAGIRGSELTAAQKKQLLALASLYISNYDDGHAKVTMGDIQKHMADTRFAWIGGTQPDSAFYYRIHSPVILIEFDHQLPIALPGMDRKIPTRDHIHAVVRTPNGNDYGKDLLRQHYATHPHGR